MLGLDLGSAERSRSMLGLVSTETEPSRPYAWFGSFCSGITIYKHKPKIPQEGRHRVWGKLSSQELIGLYRSCVVHMWCAALYLVSRCCGNCDI